MRIFHMKNSQFVALTLFRAPMGAWGVAIYENSGFLIPNLGLRNLQSLEMGDNARFKNGHASVDTRVLKTLACRKNVVGFFKHW